MADAFIIETADLPKTYGGVEALRGLSLRVPAGSIYGFLGRNGAGKTTTIKVLLGMARPTSGHARVFGLAAEAGRSQRGDPAPHRVRQRREGSLRLHDSRGDGPLHGALVPAMARRPRAALSPQVRIAAGREGWCALARMRTKLALLLALCRGAELLILDEPTSGLDPVMTEEILQALVAHVADGEMTVFFSTHQIAEVDQIADHVAIIDHGRAVVAGALDDLRENFRRIQLVFDGDAPEPAFHAPGVERVVRKGRVLTVLSSAGAERILDEARALNPVSVDVLPVTLKEIFLETVAEGD